jgi:hypothetical protein
MSDQYLLIQMEHLMEAWLRGKEVLEQALPARLEGELLSFPGLWRDLRALFGCNKFRGQASYRAGGYSHLSLCPERPR